jgi:hypothetical protein
MPEGAPATTALTAAIGLEEIAPIVAALLEQRLHTWIAELDE